MKRVMAVVIGLALLGAASVEAQEAYQVTSKVWQASGKKQWDQVVTLVDGAEKRWGAGARKTNKTLSAYPQGEAGKKYGVLNEMATMTFLKGEALRKKGDSAGALKAYRKVLTDYEYGQCWDNKGWWWQPASAAKDAIAKVAPESQVEVTVKDAPPLKASLRLPGKKGACFSLRKPGSPRGGTWDTNMPRVKALNASWNYSWGAEIVPVQPKDLEFLPMAWGAWSEDGLRKSLEKHVVPQIKSGRVKRFLGFNEPDKREQANMKYQDALKYWPILESLNVPLCSPACANPEGVDDDSIQGVKGTWMRDFMREAEKRNYRVDYTGVHWYGGTGALSFKNKMVRIYEKYGRRPLLITEFSPADWGARKVSDNDHSPEAVLEFMKDVLPWMEKQDWIAGYAWFSFEQHEAVGTSSALFDKDGKLTVLGRYYASVTPSNPDGDQSIKH